MMHFLGILSPGKLRRGASAEAPGKANFFGGLPDVAWGAVPMSRLEQDACFLSGKLPDPDERELRDPRADGMPER